MPIEATPHGFGPALHALRCAKGTAPLPIIFHLAGFAILTALPLRFVKRVPSFFLEPFCFAPKSCDCRFNRNYSLHLQWVRWCLGRAFLSRWSLLESLVVVVVGKDVFFVD